MFDHKSPSSLQTVADDVGQRAHEALDSAQHQAQEAIDVFHASAQQIKNQACNLSDNLSRSAIQSVKNDPLKSLLIAAASGAALVAVLSYLTRSRR